MPFQTELVKALRKAGVAVKEEPGWETRGNPHFSPRGVVCHHTAIADTKASLRVCTHGRPDLPGPLCQIVLAPDGVAHVIAAGRANHAGPGGWRGLSGNSSVFGIEAVHSGDRATPWPPVQVAAYERICAALCLLMDSSAEMVCAHKEWTSRKVDPARFSMPEFRDRVDALLHVAIPESERNVAPMYDPPIGPIAAVWQAEDGQVIAAVSPLGDVYAWGVPYVGGVRGKDYWGDRRAAAIGPPEEGGTYKITATSGEGYEL